MSNINKFAKNYKIKTIIHVYTDFLMCVQHIAIGMSVYVLQHVVAPQYYTILLKKNRSTLNEIYFLLCLHLNTEEMFSLRILNVITNVM